MDTAARRLDEWLFRLERLLILVSVAGMTLLVGADVMQRTFSRPVGRTSALMVWLGERLAGPLTPTGKAMLQGTAGGMVFGALSLLAFVLAAHASRSFGAEQKNAPPPKWPVSLAVGTALWVGAWGALKLLLWVFPSSVPGAQRFALGLMLWSGLLGASLAVKEQRHIMLDAITKKLDPALQRPFALLSGLVTAVFCGLVAYLGVLQISGEIREWAAHEGVGLYESLPIPTWIATLAVPVCFTTMALRFLGYAVRDFRFGPHHSDGGHGVDLEKLEQEALEPPTAPQESNP